MEHANDNTQRAPAHHRAIVEALPETRQRPAGATPLGTRLYRERRADDLRRYINFGKVAAVPSWLSAESNLPEVGSKLRADCVSEIKPNTKGEMQRISNWIKAGEEGVRCNDQGHVIEWRGADNKFRPVAELTRQPRGKRRKSEEERQRDASRHLSLRGSGGFPESLPYVAGQSDGADYWRFRHAFMLRAMNAGNDNRRAEIDRLGVGSSVPFAKARAKASLPQAERCPTGIARGAEFHAFAVHSTKSLDGFEGAHDADERQIIETIDQPKIDAALGKHVRILDLSAAGMTARQIAVELGLGDTKAAERKVVALQDQALAALAAVEERMAA
jgi:hypothetical protein